MLPNLKKIFQKDEKSKPKRSKSIERISKTVIKPKKNEKQLIQEEFKVVEDQMIQEYKY